MNIPNTPDYSKFTSDELRVSLIQAEIEIKDAQNIKKRIVDEIINRNLKAIEAALSDKDEPYGSVTIDGFEITAPKKVEWDQVQLASLYKRIQDAGEYASDYITIEYTAAESKFKAWPTPIREQFIPARTVKRGSFAVKVKEEK